MLSRFPFPVEPPLDPLDRPSPGHFARVARQLVLELAETDRSVAERLSREGGYRRAQAGRGG